MIPGVLDDHDRQQVEEHFGVDSDQVMRDHAISHVLAAIAGLGADDILFFGGTALARTHLPGLRLSEDIDLIALRDRRDTADRIETAVTQGLRRSLGAAVFTPRLRETRHPAPSVLQMGDARIQVQVLSSIGYPAWPTEVREIEQRYRDAPPAQLRVLTGPAFVASKLAAWNDRRAARDLYDLWGLALAGMIDADAVDLFAKHGAYTDAALVPFDDLPTDAEWDAALSHQCRVAVSPAAAASIVTATIARSRR